jgi:hypothetical protein
VQIFIGQESGFRILDDVSMVTAPYSADNEVVGVIGVIGPTRMAYERVIPIVDVTAKILGAALARADAAPQFFPPALISDGPTSPRSFCPSAVNSLISLRSLMPEPSTCRPHGRTEKDHGAARDGGAAGRNGAPAAELAAAEERAKNHWEQYLRALAEMDNVRKRAAKDLESTRQFASKIRQDLIGVKDSLELALANAGKADVASLSKGRAPRCGCWPRPSKRRRSKRSIPEGSRSTRNCTRP